jgi:poly(3-hydroxybutyrate) depolymerase
MRSRRYFTLRALGVFLVTVTVFAAQTVEAQSAPGAQVTIPGVETGFGSTGAVSGTFGRPVKVKDSLPAVLILHGSNGIDGRGAFYATALQEVGIATLEIFMFPGEVDHKAVGRACRMRQPRCGGCRPSGTSMLNVSASWGSPGAGACPFACRVK